MTSKLVSSAPPHVAQVQLAPDEPNEPVKGPEHDDEEVGEGGNSKEGRCEPVDPYGLAVVHERVGVRSAALGLVPDALDAMDLYFHLFPFAMTLVQGEDGPSGVHAEGEQVEQPDPLGSGDGEAAVAAAADGEDAKDERRLLIFVQDRLPGSFFFVVDCLGDGRLVVSGNSGELGDEVVGVSFAVWVVEHAADVLLGQIGKAESQGGCVGVDHGWG